jgi:long-chain acyl-CoA synthetase
MMGVECAVKGMPDALMREEIGAIVMLKPARQLNPRRFASFSKGLADFKIPQYMLIRPETLPRNPDGEILKSRL